MAVPEAVGREMGESDNISMSKWRSGSWLALGIIEVLVVVLVIKGCDMIQGVPLIEGR